jgi:hypothetical protein
MQSVIWQWQLSPHPLVLLILTYLAPCPYHCGGMGGGVGGGVGNGGGSVRQQSSSKWMRAPALKANADGNGMDKDGMGPKTKYRKIKY